MKLKLLGASALVLALATGVVWANGLWPGLPIEGGASYCGGYASSQGGQSAFGTGQCSVTVPAGQASPTGTEAIPSDLYGLAQDTNSQGLPQTNLIAASALGGFGPVVVSTTTGAQTIPNNSPNYVVNVSETAASALTMPASPQPWQMQRIAVVVATGASGSVTLTANTGQTLVPSSITVAGNSATGSAMMLWNPVTSAWDKIQ